MTNKTNMSGLTPPNTEKTMNSAKDHVPELDGIRGLAILPVLIYHFVDRYPKPDSGLSFIFYKITQAGWVGVDLFFVLSGFLITGILVDTKNNERFFSAFYGRRLLRIFPLYYIMLMAYFWVGPFLSADLAQQYSSMREHQSWFWFYLSNWLFSSASETIPGLYFWSLAVEEQFYMVWPLLVWLTTTRSMFFLSLGLIGFSFGIRLILMLGFDYSAASVYYMTLTHMDGLAVGACISLAVSLYGVKRNQLIKPTLFGILCLLAILFTALMNSGFAFWNKNVGLFSYTLLAILFGCMLVYTLRSSVDSIARKIFNNSFMRLSGKYSYALYLFHVPLANLVQTLVFDRFIPRNQVLDKYFITIIPFIVITSAVSYLFAFISWNLFEKRVLSLKKYFEY
jgi:peptidoglycan/LPS O-acetylase OafA/YrhL